VAYVANEELEGNTLNVYAYVVHKGKPVGTRDVTRGANLSSPSVAHRHLQSTLSKHGLRLDIIYDDPAYPVTGRYKQIYYWNQAG
jgi:hypothetical protein